jgi:hypothetical protein
MKRIKEEKKYDKIGAVGCVVDSCIFILILIFILGTPGFASVVLKLPGLQAYLIALSLLIPHPSQTLKLKQSR